VQERCYFLVVLPAKKHRIDAPDSRRAARPWSASALFALELATFGFTIPFLMTVDETFDVGVDTRTPVDDVDYQVPFRFTGKLNKLTFMLGPTQLTSDDHQVIQHALAKAKD
jgi:hypothetical protein